MRHVKSDIHWTTVTSFANTCCRRHVVEQVNHSSSQFSESCKDS